MTFFNFRPKLKILFLATEAAPFMKAGGLGEVMFSLPRALKAIGYDARIMIPRYAGIDQERFPLQMEEEQLSVPTDSKDDQRSEYLICNVKSYVPPEDDGRAPVRAYFLENQEYYEQRANVYGYADDAVRWALFGRGALEFLRINRKWTPDLIVAADWQAAFAINYLRTVYNNDRRLRNIAAIFSIHNLFYQGNFDHHFVSEMDFDSGQEAIPSFYDPRLLKLNMMRRGIKYADAINTVSPTYAKEIMTPEYGEMLDGLLRERRSAIYGILNGIDYETVNPKTDPHLEFPYDIHSLPSRSKNKEKLQDRFGLPKNKSAFLAAVVSRLDSQKGLDLLFETLEPMILETGMQLVVVGSGGGDYMNFFNEMSKKFPDNVGVNLNFDLVLPHLVFGGADVLLMPSRFEPSGLAQMEAMRYGAVPIVRKTGGLSDTVEDYNPNDDTGTGFVFDKFHPLSFTMTVSRAFENYRHSKVWRGLQERAMKKDFSWEHSAVEYGKLFVKAADIRLRSLEEKEF